MLPEVASRSRPAVVVDFIREARSETSRAIAPWKIFAILNLACARVHVVLPLLPDLVVGLVRVRD